MVVPALEMRGITKRYPGVVANDHIDLDVRPGEIHALLGENGAGKTTLMNILYGLARPDEGQILLDGQPVAMGGPGRCDRPWHQHGPPALHAGTGPDGRGEHPCSAANPWPTGCFLDSREASRRIRPAARFGFDIDPDATVSTLSVGRTAAGGDPASRSYREARILVLDEPTAVLTPPGDQRDIRPAADVWLRPVGASSSSVTSCMRSWRWPIGSP